MIQGLGFRIKGLEEDLGIQERYMEWISQMTILGHPIKQYLRRPTFMDPANPMFYKIRFME